MRRTLRHQLKNAFEDREKTQVKEWLFKWPAQIISLIEEIKGTVDVEQAISQGKMEQYAKQRKDFMNLIVDMIRKSNSELERSTLSTLIIHGVHTSDKVSVMVNLQTSSLDDFVWQSHPRYYCTYLNSSQVDPDLDLDLVEEDQLYTSDFSKTDVVINGCKLKILTNCIRYEFEYIGNGPRLVITPLTDRCFRTLFSAYKFQYGGACEGPAGTGKTESVKDLAKVSCARAHTHMTPLPFFLPWWRGVGAPAEAAGCNSIFRFASRFKLVLRSALRGVQRVGRAELPGDVQVFQGSG